MWHKRRWRCREALCERATFIESLPAVPARARITARVRAACGEGIGEVFSCVAAGAAFYGISWPIAHAAFIAHADPLLGEPLPHVTVLGIDETRRGKEKWVQDPDTHKWRVDADRWHTGIVDAQGTGGLLGHVEGRTAALVAAWLQDQPQSWRDVVTHVTIDLSASYAKAVTVALPSAVLVANRRRLLTDYEHLSTLSFTSFPTRASARVRRRRNRSTSTSKPVTW